MERQSGEEAPERAGGKIPIPSRRCCCLTESIQESAQQQREAASTLLTLRHHADETLAQAEAERMERENAAHAAQEAEVAAMRSQHAGANRFVGVSFSRRALDH